MIHFILYDFVTGGIAMTAAASSLEDAEAAGGIEHGVIVTEPGFDAGGKRVNLASLEIEVIAAVMELRRIAGTSSFEVLVDGVLTDAMVSVSGEMTQWSGVVPGGQITVLAPGETIIIATETTNNQSVTWSGVLAGGGDVGALVPADPDLVSATVNYERDLRARTRFTFAGRPFDFDGVSLQRITGAGASAGFAVAAGKQPGDVFWFNAAFPFAWIDADNMTMPMDAQTCFAFSQAAGAHESAHVFAGRALKEAAILPADWRDDAYWPCPPAPPNAPQIQRRDRMADNDTLVTRMPRDAATFIYTQKLPVEVKIVSNVSLHGSAALALAEDGQLTVDLTGTSGDPAASEGAASW